MFCKKFNDQYFQNILHIWKSSSGVEFFNFEIE